MTPLDQLVAQYEIVITRSAENDGYVATVPILPGCSAFGEDRMEAAREITDAINAWIVSAMKANKSIPFPAERA